jgi:hypothetical protein
MFVLIIDSGNAEETSESHSLRLKRTLASERNGAQSPLR